MSLVELKNQLRETLLRLDKVVTDLESEAKSTSSPPNKEIVEIETKDAIDKLRLIQEYDDLIMITFKSWADVSKKIGDDVYEESKLVEKLFGVLRDFLKHAVVTEKPNDKNDLQKLLDPILKTLLEINAFRLKKKESPFFTHLEAVEAAVAAVQWVTVACTPAPLISDMLDCSTFYLNRILTKYKETDPIHVEWVNLWKLIWQNMHQYVKKSHTTGVAWNFHPGQMKSPTTAPIPPPPPPPLNPKLFENLEKSLNEVKADRNALFDQINQGDQVTSRLKKVTADMQTHKNPELRGKENIPPGSENNSKYVESKKANDACEKRSIKMKNDKQWIVEYVQDDANVIIEVTDKSHSVYIYKCKNSLITIKGKANAIVVDGCTKAAIKFDGLVSQIEVINSQAIQIQTLGELSTVSIQKTDGCQVYLSKDALQCQVVSSKSSEMNILAQLNDDNEDYVEMAIPEQFVTRIVAKKLITSSSETV